MSKPEIDIENKDYIKNIIQAEEKFIKDHGRYLQMLNSHEVTPKDNQPTTPTKSKKPTDQNENWSDLCRLPIIMETNVRIDIYEGPLGKGFIICNFIEKNKDIWRKITDYGPEGRSSDWVNLTQLEPIENKTL